MVRDTRAAACAVIIEKFLRATGVEIDPAIATCLMTGIVTDTGRFQYQNADAAAFASAARLVAAGADPAWIALNVYQSQRPEYLRLKGLVMKRLMVCPVEGGAIAYSFATHEDLERCGVSPDECDGSSTSCARWAGSTCACFCAAPPTGACAATCAPKARSTSRLWPRTRRRRSRGGGGLHLRRHRRRALGAVLPRLRALVAEGEQAGA